MICEEGGYCLEQWCLYIHRLKSGFSRVDFGVKSTAVGEVGIIQATGYPGTQE